MPDREQPPEVEHVDRVAHVDHELHVVLDQHHGHAAGGQLAQQLGEALGLGRVLAGGRLVEQQHRRVAGQRPGQLDQAGLAGGHRGDPQVGDLGEPDPLDELVDLGGRVDLRPRPAAVDVGGHPDVVAHREHGEQLEPLEGAAQALAGPLGGAEPGDVAVVEQRPDPA